MGAKRRDRGDYDEVRRHGSYVMHKAAKHDEHRTAYRANRYTKYSKDHGSSRHSHHDAEEHRRPLQHNRSEKNNVEPVKSPEEPLGKPETDKGIVDLSVEEHKPDDQPSEMMAEEHQSAGQTAEQTLASKMLADEHESAGQAEDAEAVPEIAVDVAQEVESVTAQEAAGAEELVQGVPHTPEVQDVKCSSPSGACRIVDEFEKLGRLGEGTYGVVYKARDKRTGEIVALKKIKMYNQDTEGFPVTSLREINLLISLQHPSIVNVREVVVGKDMDSVFMVMEHIENNLKDSMARLKQPFDYGQIKRMMLQLLEGVACLHDNWVLHRDLKPSNILVTGEGELRICDFGLARRYDSPIKTYTHNVVTMWYRAPELLISKNKVKYSTAIDVWSLGCIMAELILSEPLFAGDSEIDQMRRIKKLIPRGSFENLGFIFPSQKLSSLRERILYPAANAGRPILSEKGFDLLSRLLTYDPEKRITAKEALNHTWFEEEPLPGTKELPADGG